MTNELAIIKINQAEESVFMLFIPKSTGIFTGVVLLGLAFTVNHEAGLLTNNRVIAAGLFPTPALGQTLLAQQNDPEVIYRQGIEDYKSGKLPEALTAFEQAVTIWRQQGDTAGEARSLFNIAIIYHKQNQPEKAIEFFNQFLEIAQTSDTTDWRTKLRLGIAREKLGQQEAALDLYWAALEMAQQAGEKEALAAEYQVVCFSNLEQEIWIPPDKPPNIDENSCRPETDSAAEIVLFDDEEENAAVSQPQPE
ncbi:tetratricopeptide repeat protein [[Phormidium] sp. ETS-05]|uniref:tetratricopeptide repeat protein n=1 Tax=[Phormidium] sp. ETS-05 TaxID=222819 RepID=UPI0018EED277|nr:tetratricopeptide repeat protein [[Phormidium] sp. ETS-05]